MTREEVQDFWKDLWEEDPNQAFFLNMATFMNLRDQQERTARSIVPDYDRLPVDQIDDNFVAQVAQNPQALKGIIARAYGPPPGWQQQQQPRQQQQRQPQQNQGNPQQQPQQQRQPTQEELIQQAREQERQAMAARARSSGTMGEGAGGSPQSGESVEGYELTPEAIGYFKARGYTDAEIKDMAPKIMEMRRRKGLIA